jgi:hypothetical protein
MTKHCLIRLDNATDQVLLALKERTKLRHRDILRGALYHWYDTGLQKLTIPALGPYSRTLNWFANEYDMWRIGELAGVINGTRSDAVRALIHWAAGGFNSP